MHGARRRYIGAPRKSDNAAPSRRPVRPEEGDGRLALRTRFNPNDHARCDFVGERHHKEGAMPIRQFIVVGTVSLAAACGSSESTPGSQALAAMTAAEPSAAAQLGGPPTGAG